MDDDDDDEDSITLKRRDWSVNTCTNYRLIDVLKKNEFLIYVYITLRRNKILTNIFHYLARLSLGLQAQ